MSLVLGAHDLGPAHAAAMDWAASLTLALPRMQRANILEAWNGADGQVHRAQLKQTGQSALRQLVDLVRDRLKELEPAPPEAFAS